MKLLKLRERTSRWAEQLFLLKERCPNETILCVSSLEPERPHELYRAYRGQRTHCQYLIATLIHVNCHTRSSVCEYHEAKYTLMGKYQQGHAKVSTWKPIGSIWTQDKYLKHVLFSNSLIIADTDGIAQVNGIATVSNQ